MEKLVVPLLLREVESKKKQLTKEQLDIFENLSARQYKSVLVKEFLKLDKDDRDILVESLAEEISKTLEPLFEAANASVVSAPAPAPETVEAVLRVDATVKRFDHLSGMLEGVLASTRVYAGVDRSGRRRSAICSASRALRPLLDSSAPAQSPPRKHRRPFHGAR